MNTTVEVAMSVQIRDAAALHSQASRSFLDSGGRTEEVESWLGTSGEPEIGNCVQQLLGRIPQDAGGFIRDCTTTVRTPGEARLRTVVTACASTSHIRNEELVRIDAEFGIEGGVMGHRARNEIIHDGLRLNPTDSGFVVRMPGEDRIEEIRHMWTPEMAKVLDVAIAQGATRVEFHAEECEIEGIEVHEH